jgi:hypothetical protein
MSCNQVVGRVTHLSCFEHTAYFFKPTNKERLLTMDGADTLLFGALTAAILAYNQANPSNQLTDQQVFAKLVTFFQTTVL